MRFDVANQTHNATTQANQTVAMPNVNASSPLTVFVPSNSAWDALGIPQDVDVSRLTAKQKLLLFNTMLYHIINGNLSSDHIQGQMFPQTLLTNTSFVRLSASTANMSASAMQQNQTQTQSSNATTSGSADNAQVLHINRTNDVILILRGLGRNAVADFANVTRADVQGSNGVAHVIDSFLLIPNSVAGTVLGANMSEFIYHLARTELFPMVEATPNITVFMPVDAAFKNLSSMKADMSAWDLDATDMKMHVLQGVHHLFNQTGNFTNLAGQNLTFTFNNNTGDSMVENARVLVSDVIITNGVMHVVDKVLMVPRNNTAESSTGLGLLEKIVDPQTRVGLEASSSTGATGAAQATGTAGNNTATGGSTGK